MITTISSGDEYTITTANGEEMCPTKNNDLTVIHNDKNGQELQRLVLQILTGTPHGSYTRFSVTKRMKYRWELCGDITKVGIRKKKKKADFDIVINTPKGSLICTYFKRNT